MGNFMNKMATMGNTFHKESVSFGHAKKVWREIREVLPGGGVIQGVAELYKASPVIRGGWPVKFDDQAKTITYLKQADIEACVTGDIVDSAKVAALGINGMLKDDAPLQSKDDVATGTVVVDGDIYGYTLPEKVEKVLRAMPQLNGMKIRVVN